MLKARVRPAKKPKTQRPERPRFTGTRRQIAADHRKAQSEIAVARMKERVLGDIDGAMVQVIITSMVANGRVTVDDFKRSGIPPQEIELRFRRCMNRALEEAPQIRRAMADA